MTQEEEKEIIRVCGINYEPSDVPAYIRQRDFNDEIRQVVAEDRMAEEELTDMFGEGGKEEVKEFYEAEKFDYHPRPEEVN